MRKLKFMRITRGLNKNSIVNLNNKVFYILIMKIMKLIKNSKNWMIAQKSWNCINIDTVRLWKCWIQLKESYWNALNLKFVIDLIWITIIIYTHNNSHGSNTTKHHLTKCHDNIIRKQSHEAALWLWGDSNLCRVQPKWC